MPESRLRGSVIITPDGINQLLTIAEASRFIGVSVETIRKWSKLKKIQPSGRNPAGHNLYRLIDIARCEKDTRIASGRATELELYQQAAQ
jgi:hypothetical protein